MVRSPDASPSWGGGARLVLRSNAAWPFTPHGCESSSRTPRRKSTGIAGRAVGYAEAGLPLSPGGRPPCATPSPSDAGYVPDTDWGPDHCPSELRSTRPALRERYGQGFVFAIRGTTDRDTDRGSGCGPVRPSPCHLFVAARCARSVSPALQRGRRAGARSAASSGRSVRRHPGGCRTAGDRPTSFWPCSADFPRPARTKSHCP